MNVRCHASVLLYKAFASFFLAFYQVILALGDFMNVQCHACIGGKSIGEDIRRLDYGVQVRTLETQQQRT